MVVLHITEHTKYILVYFYYKINQYFCLSAKMGNILLLDALKVNSTEDFYKDWGLKT